MRKIVKSSIRKAMYWCSPNRTYRLTKGEQCSGACCPRCKGEMTLYSFTKKEKMFMCKDCEFMISSGSVISAGNFRGKMRMMKSRRGSVNWKAIDQFSEGDIVTNVASTDSFIGRVTDVDGKINKVMVLWGAGSSEIQHDPDEIMLHPHANDVRAKMAKMDKMANVEEEDFVRDPETHGIEDPRGGGVSIMQTLQEDLHEESQDLVASVTRRMRNKH